MNHIISRADTRLRGLAVPMLFAAALIVTACGSADDEPDAEDPAAVTNVEPVAAARTQNPPEVPLPPQEEAEREPAIDGAPEQGDTMAQAEPQLYATAMIAPASGSDVIGELRFHQDGEGVRIQGALEGLTAGEHGLHVHAVGDCSAPDAASAMGHFAPDGDPHGSPQAPVDRHHVGDLGNISANEAGFAEIDKTDAEMTLGTGAKSIIGRAVIVHAGADDLTSQPSGDAGARVGCGVVEADVSPAYQGAAGGG